MINRKYVQNKGRIRDSSRKHNDEPDGECLRAAIRLLKYRQRSENELRIKLGSRFEKSIIDGVIDRLCDKHMVDDINFARYWREQREKLNPRSRRMVCLELSKKGIDKEVIDKVLCDFDDEENAYRAARKKANLLSKEDRDKFIRRISAFLMRRGFNYTVTKRTVDRLWRESS